MALAEAWSGLVWKIFQKHHRHSPVRYQQWALGRPPKDANLHTGVLGRLAGTWGRDFILPGTPGLGLGAKAGFG